MDNQQKKFTKKEKQLSAVVQSLQSSIDEQQLRLLEDSKKLGASKATIENLSSMIERQNEDKADQKKRMHALYLLYCKERDALKAALKKLKRYEQTNDKEKEEPITSNQLRKNDELEIEKLKNDLEFVESYKKKVEIYENEKAELTKKLREITDSCEIDISKYKKDAENTSNT